MIEFDIQPFSGALPLRFGMTKPEVHSALGPPEATHEIWNHTGTTNYWLRSCVNAGFDLSGCLNHIGFGPGAYLLRLQGSPLWSPTHQPDPNPFFLALDPCPLETLGILVFREIGISTSGYHDDDPAQYSIALFPRGAWDNDLADAVPPDLSRYRLP